VRGIGSVRRLRAAGEVGGQCSVERLSDAQRPVEPAEVIRRPSARCLVTVNFLSRTNPFGAGCRILLVMTASDSRVQSDGMDPPGLDDLLRRVARGDESAFADVYDQLAPRVYGLIQRIVRDPAQAEEVAQEALVDVWRTAARYDPDRGSVISWVLTIAHRRAVDRVRAEQASADRTRRAAVSDVAFDEVVEAATARFEQQQVRRCLKSLTDLQREAVDLAYYRGYTYREVADLLDTALPTVKTRMRDALIRLRDCLGVSIG
jgi:RNA polymerase sigma-70 factor (ECF subfamily)